MAISPPCTRPVEPTAINPVPANIIQPSDARPMTTSASAVTIAPPTVTGLRLRPSVAATARLPSTPPTP